MFKNKHKFTVHRQSKIVNSMIKGMERDGYYYYDGQRCKIVDAKQTGEFLEIEVVYLQGGA